MYTQISLSSDASSLHITLFVLIKVIDNDSDDSDLSKHMIYQIDQQVIEHNRMIKTSSHSTQ